MDQRRLSQLLALNHDLAMALPKSNEVEISLYSQAVVNALQTCISADAIVVLQAQGDVLIPQAFTGLAPEVMGRRFKLCDHPRLASIAKSPDQPVVFSSDCALSDPYDGMLLAEDGELPVHACMGFSLYEQGLLLGVVTFDSLTPNAFDAYSRSLLTMIQSAVCAHFSAVFNTHKLAKRAQSGLAMLHELSHQSHTMIGESVPMERLKSDINLVANSDLSVLIQGETGTGKELVARQVHSNSSRCNAPFVQVNCASLPENLAESEFFGHRKGAFTGADSNREGKFLVADQGTLFLDEIGELPLHIQSKLLRALQSGEIQPVGSDKPHHVNVRIVAATNRDLQKEVEEGRFRADLYHRLRVFPLQVPPLRERATDIVPLAGYFVEQLRKKIGVSQLVIDSSLLAQLQSHDWPGNVRELEHVLSRAALKAKHADWQKEIIKIMPSHCEITYAEKDRSANLSQPAQPNHADINSLKDATEQFQKQLILQKLNNENLNWAAAARSLDIDRANLVRLAKRLGIETIKKVK
ncbi:nitric oxide reductase transcriptional regulator NorR [Pseudoalteromonas luteoviolacea]|uniref:nitric oxide reductase transcriptional regulator NorR n=1 Tax=Pseudoalteromonas luteoviolacea TaxID=43657 RepID=UPI00114FA2CF|nr:nitric oxide reductase transcriptional regulator NorR [Pseudoalteromonas luteoviolacea]TQF71164.1 nitric oxide reductase transcriptional regulator NorR [Pseudoalteromonas luteoviolacea]